MVPRFTLGMYAQSPTQTAQAVAVLLYSSCFHQHPCEMLAAGPELAPPKATEVEDPEAGVCHVTTRRAAPCGSRRRKVSTSRPSSPYLLVNVKNLLAFSWRPTKGPTCSG